MENTSLSQETYSLAYSSMLTEDYMHTDVILASPTASAPLATFLNRDGQSEALVVFDDGELCHLQREPLSSSGWNFNGIGAQVGAITAANGGSVWMIDSGQNVWMSNTGHWNFVGEVSGGGLNISAGLDGTVYAVTNQSGSFHLFTFDPVSGSFQDQGTVPVGNAPLGKPGSLWALMSRKLFTNSNGGWHEVYTAFEAADVPAQLSLGSDGSIWIGCENGAIYSYDASAARCQKMIGVPSNIFCLAAADANTLYVLNTNPHEENRLFTSEGGTWKQIVDPFTPIAEISVGNDGVLWARDLSGRLWQRNHDEWVRQIMPTDLSGATGGHKVTEVVTGKHNDGGVQYAFFIMDSDLYWSRLVGSAGPYGGFWEHPQFLISGCSNIATVNDPSNYQLLVYGVSSTGNFVLVESDGKFGWKATEFRMSTSLADTKLVFLFDGSWLTYAIIKNTLYVGKGSLKSPATSLSAAKTNGPVPTGLRDIRPFATSSYGTSGTLLAAIDSQNQVWTVSGSSGIVYFSQLTGSAVGSAVSSVESVVAMLHPAEGGARIYARDKDNFLWITRQTAISVNKPPQPNTIIWSDWHPLGNECIVLATGCTIPPPGAAHTAPVDLFTLDAGYEVNVLSEDPITGVLTDLVMLKPDGTNGDAEYVTRYLSEITVVDENSAPQPNVEVAITATEAIGIWVGTTLYNVTPRIPINLSTNQLGKITFAFFAADLHTPTFYFKADGIANPPNLNPARAVHEYLSGSETALPNRPVFTPDGSALVAAKMQTGPGWNTAPTPLLEDRHRDKAGAVAGAVTSVFNFSVDANGQSGQWSVAAGQPTGMSASGFWHDLCKFPHDIDHGIKNAALKVRQIAVNVRDRVVAFTMEIANGLSQVLHLAINTLKDIISAVKTAFRYIERGVEEMIHWLKSLFNWNDILNSKRILEASLNGIMTKLAENLDPKSPSYAGKALDKYFGDLETSILGGFDKAKKHFSKTQTYSEAANSAPYPEGARPMGDDPLSPTDTSNAESSNSAQTNYVHTHVTNYSNGGGSFPPATMGDGSSGDPVLKVLFEAIEKNLEQGKFREEQMRTIDNVQSIFSDPKNFANVVMYDLITAVEDLVDVLLKIIQGVLDALISLAGNAVKGLQELMSKPIEIPVISWIYKQIAHHTLTMLDLLCLLVAVPATLLYKLTFGLPNAAPPFTAKQTEQIVAELSNSGSFPWPSVPGTEAAVSLARNSEFTSSDAFVAFIPAFAVASSATDMINDVIAYEMKWAKKTAPAVLRKQAKLGSLYSIAFGLGSRWYGAPFSLFPTSGKDVSEKMQLTMWSAGFLPILTNIVFTVASSEGALAKYNSTKGNPLMSAIGSLLLALGLATSGEQIYQHIEHKADLDIFQTIANSLFPVPTLMTFLIDKGAIPALVLVGIDGVFDLGCGALSLLSALVSNYGASDVMAST